MRTGTYYLNNTGSKWVTFPKPKVKIRLTDGSIKERTALWFEQFGNYAAVAVSYKGIVSTYLPSDTETIDGLPVVNIVDSCHITV